MRAVVCTIADAVRLLHDRAALGKVVIDIRS